MNKREKETLLETQKASRAGPQPCKYLETKMNYYNKKKEYQSEYYKNKYVFDIEYRNRILQTSLKYQKENKERCLISKQKYMQKKNFEKFGYLFRSPYPINIISKPIV